EGFVESGVLAAREQVAMLNAVGAAIPSHDLALGVDPGSDGERPRRGLVGGVDQGVLVADLRVAVKDVAGVDVEAHDLSGVIDRVGLSALAGSGSRAGVVEEVLEDVAGHRPIFEGLQTGDKPGPWF